MVETLKTMNYLDTSNSIVFWYSFERTSSEVWLPQYNAITILYLPLRFPRLASSIHNTLVVPAGVAVVAEVVVEVVAVASCGSTGVQFRPPLVVLPPPSHGPLQLCTIRHGGCQRPAFNLRHGGGASRKQGSTCCPEGCSQSWGPVPKSTSVM